MKKENSLISRKEDLSKHASYEIGGKADYFASPATVEELLEVLSSAKKLGITPTIFGLGANILFPDKPRRNQLFLTVKRLMEVRFTQTGVFVSSGVPLSFLPIIGQILNENGFDFTYLLPGCLASGIFMNAKYYESQICDILQTVYYIDITDESPLVRTIPAASCGFAYKKSLFQNKDWIIIGADLFMDSDDKRITQEQRKEIESALHFLKSRDMSLSSLPLFYKTFQEAASVYGRRPEILGKIALERTSKKHFTWPSCGSVFKNNYSFGVPMGVVIDKLGLKGLTRGGALIPEHHGNMIVNTGGAKADDVIYLIKTVQEKVQEAHGFVPEPELVILDERM